MPLTVSELPLPRHQAVRLAFFNHKGGVGKTTITANVAFALARARKRVLLVDSDPQCNLTSYLVDEEVVDDLLDSSDGANGRTLWSALKPVIEGAGPPTAVAPFERSNNLFLLPGDIRLAEFENELYTLWGECFQRKIRGFRGVVALSQLVNQTAHRYQADYVLYDSGPNIGSLNRAVLLDCDYFAIPAACDVFSLRAISTLGHTLSSWIQLWSTVVDLAPTNLYLLPGQPCFIGYIPQRFRVYADRPAKEFAAFLPRIERTIQADLVEVLARINTRLVPKLSTLKLGEVKDLGTLATAAQVAGVAVSDARSGTSEQRRSAEHSFDELANTIIQRTRP